MKKLLTLLLTAVLALSLTMTLTACGSKSEASAGEIVGNSTVSTGDLIQLGDIFWRVLDVQDSKVLIISESTLETRAYHELGGEITWEHSTIRNYLNDEFLNSTFSTEEQRRIMETAVINDENPIYGTHGGNDTTDKIFLLSIDEAKEYFAEDSARIAYGADGNLSWWWLRSPGNSNHVAADVYIDGCIYDNNNTYIDDNSGIRPALWLNTD